MTEEHTSTMLTKQCLSTIKYLQNEKNPYFLSPSYQIFTIHQKEKKKGEILPVTVGTVLATYAIYKQLK